MFFDPASAASAHNDSQTRLPENPILPLSVTAVQTLSKVPGMIGAFLDETQSRSTMWARWESFFRDHHEPRNFLKLVPGLGQRDMSTLSALDILRRDLHDLTRYSLIHTQTVDVLCGTVLYPKPKRDTRVIVQPIAYGSSKGSSLNRPVWIARLDVVERAVREGRLDTISCLGI